LKASKVQIEKPKTKIAAGFFRPQIPTDKTNPHR